MKRILLAFMTFSIFMGASMNCVWGETGGLRTDGEYNTMKDLGITSNGAETTSSLTIARNNTDNAIQALVDANSKLDTAQTNLTNLQTQLTAAQKDLKSYDEGDATGIQGAQANIKNLENQVNQAQQQANTAQAQAVAMQERVNVQQANLIVIETSVATANIQSAQAKVDELQKAYENAIDETQQNDIQLQLDQAQQDLTTAQKNLAAIQNNPTSDFWPPDGVTESAADNAYNAAIAAKNDRINEIETMLNENDSGLTPSEKAELRKEQEKLETEVQEGKTGLPKQELSNEIPPESLASPSFIFSTKPLSPGGNSANYTTGNSKDNIINLIKKIVDTLLIALSSIAVLLIAVGGLLMAVSAGNNERVSKGKNIIMFNLQALVVALLSYSIIQFVAWIVR